MEIWFTADQHFGHANIIRHCHRPFANAGAMNMEIVRRHNAVVQVWDTVYHLGDFCWNARSGGGALGWFLRALNGTHILVAGNHDSCNDVHRRWKREVARYLEAGFVEVHQNMFLDVPGIGKVLLSHLPDTHLDWYDGRYEDRRPNPDDTVAAQFCGHVHDSWKTRGRSINVGVDQWGFSPVRQSDLVSWWKMLDGSQGRPPSGSPA